MFYVLGSWIFSLFFPGSSSQLLTYRSHSCLQGSVSAGSSVWNAFFFLFFLLFPLLQKPDVSLCHKLWTFQITLGRSVNVESCSAQVLDT
jgi:hypothetical protein